MSDLTSYIERGKKLLADSANNINPMQTVSKIQHPVGHDRRLPDNLDKFLYEEEITLSNKPNIGFVLVAGGLGERLGYSDLKIKIHADSIFLHVCYLEWFSRHISRVDPSSLFIIMTSDDTHEKTVEYLSTNSNFGLKNIHILKQEKVPCFSNTSGELAVDTNGNYIMKPHGHGDVHSLIYESGLLKKFKVDYLCFFQDTNGLSLRPLYNAVGICIENDLDMLSICVPRVPKEPVGAICHLEYSDDKPPCICNVEYNLLDSFLPNGDCGVSEDQPNLSPFPGNINCFILKSTSYQDSLEKTRGIVPEFINPKYTDNTNTKLKSPARLECMMQDIAQTFPDYQKVSFAMYDRQMCFSAVKNDNASAKTKVLNNQPAESAFSAERDLWWSNYLSLSNFSREVFRDENKKVELEFNGINQDLPPVIIGIDPLTIGFNLTDLKKLTETILTSKLLLKNDSFYSFTNIQQIEEEKECPCDVQCLYLNGVCQYPVIGLIPCGDDADPSVQLRGYILGRKAK